MEKRKLKISVFYDMTSRSQMLVNRGFSGEYGLHYQSQRVSLARNRYETGIMTSSCFLLQDNFLLGHENGGNMFLRNLRLLSPDYSAF
jgi:hypothetical protein